MRSMWQCFVRIRSNHMLMSGVNLLLLGNSTRKTLHGITADSQKILTAKLAVQNVSSGKILFSEKSDGLFLNPGTWKF